MSGNTDAPEWARGLVPRSNTRDKCDHGGANLATHGRAGGASTGPGRMRGMPSCSPLGSSPQRVPLFHITSLTMAAMAKSYVCNDCGLQLRSIKEAQDHGEVTGHSNFAESEEAVLTLVCEECGCVRAWGYARATIHNTHSPGNSAIPQPAAPWQLTRRNPRRRTSRQEAVPQRHGARPPHYSHRTR